MLAVKRPIFVPMGARFQPAPGPKAARVAPVVTVATASVRILPQAVVFAVSAIKPSSRPK